MKHHTLKRADVCYSWTHCCLLDSLDVRDQFHAPAALYLGVGGLGAASAVPFWKGRWLGHTADREGVISLPCWLTNPVSSVALRSDSCYLYPNVRTKVSVVLCMNIRGCPAFHCPLATTSVPPAPDRFRSRCLHAIVIARSEPSPSVPACRLNYRPVPASWHLRSEQVRKTEEEGGPQMAIASLARRIPSPSRPPAFLKYLPSVKMWQLDCRWSALGFRERRIFPFSTASKLAVWP
jgi:hypothetical protein